MDYGRFKKTIEKIKYMDRFQDKISDLCTEFNRNNGMGEEMTIWFPSLVCTVIDLLEYMFDDEETNWISYFIFDLEYGEKYEDGMVTEEDGTIVKLATIRDLYDMLTKNEKLKDKAE